MRKESIFHSIVGGTKPVNKSTICRVEADLAVKYGKLLLQNQSNSTVAVLCHYYGQVVVARKMRGPNCRFEICTSDSFQGREVDCVVLSTCGQGKEAGRHINDRARACVGLSRARNRLIILGSKRTLVRSKMWRDIMGHCSHVEGSRCSMAAVR